VAQPTTPAMDAALLLIAQRVHASEKARARDLLAVMESRDARILRTSFPGISLVMEVGRTIPIGGFQHRTLDEITPDEARAAYRHSRHLRRRRLPGGEYGPAVALAAVVFAKRRDAAAQLERAA